MTNTNLIQNNDSHLTVNDLQVIEDEPRIKDVVLGERLGLRKAVSIRQVIDANIQEIQGFGEPIWESKVGVPVNFAYTNACGKKTKRRVTLHKIFKDSKTRFYFRGYCKTRRASRTFNSEKIENLHDANGEVLELSDFIDKLVGYKAFGTEEIRMIEE